MDRRTLLKTGVPAALAFAIGGRAAVAQGTAPTGSAGPRRYVNLVPVKCSMDRIIRTTVGLRPVRESGFLLRADRIDDKTVIHNYGHGGGGMTMSWGTGFLAADLAMPHAERRAAVIGCGVVGLTAARQLQRRGFDVAIYAASVPPNTTSNMSLANFEGRPSDERRRRAWDIAYNEVQKLVGCRYGVRWLRGYFPERNGSRPSSPSPPTSGPTYPLDWELFGPGEHPFPEPFAVGRSSLHFEPSIYLDALVRDVLAFGGRIRIRTFDTVSDLMALDERLIVNCTGIGAKALFGDDELTPVRGQSVLLIPQPDVTYQTWEVTPRQDGIVLGATENPGNWSLDVDEVQQRRRVEIQAEVFAKMLPTLPGVPITGLDMIGRCGY